MALKKLTDFVSVEDLGSFDIDTVISLSSNNEIKRFFENLPFDKYIYLKILLTCGCSKNNENFVRTIVFDMAFKKDSVLTNNAWFGTSFVGFYRTSRDIDFGKNVMFIGDITFSAYNTNTQAFHGTLNLTASTTQANNFTVKKLNIRRII